MREVMSTGFLVIRRQPEVSFLLLRHPDRWDLPKGHLDPGETPAECALRELEEETEREELPETPHEIILGRIAQLITERPEDAAKLIRTMLIEDAQQREQQAP